MSTTGRKKLQGEASSPEPSRAQQCNAAGVTASLHKAVCPSIRKHNESELSRTLSRIDRRREKNAPALRRKARRYLPSLAARYVPFFFFQAEDGIRDYKVTGVQTCALP